MTPSGRPREETRAPTRLPGSSRSGSTRSARVRSRRPGCGRSPRPPRPSESPERGPCRRVPRREGSDRAALGPMITIEPRADRGETRPGNPPTSTDRDGREDAAPRTGGGRRSGIEPARRAASERRPWIQAFHDHRRRRRGWSVQPRNRLRDVSPPALPSPRLVHDEHPGERHRDRADAEPFDERPSDRLPPDVHAAADRFHDHCGDGYRGNGRTVG